MTSSRIQQSNSAAILSRLGKVMPGAASSNARCGWGLVMARGDGAYIYDVDGNRYIDYILGFGPVLLGHAHPAVNEAVCRSLEKGTTFAFTNDMELLLAEKIVACCPSVEMVRFCNSGSDAATTACRIACATTGRSKVIKIQGDYNGNPDVLLYDVPGVEATNLQSGPTSVSLGISEDVTRRACTVPFNDLHAMEQAFYDNEGQIAAVLMEPVLGNTASILPNEDYLQKVAVLCRKHGAVLIFDEVKTGFRVARGGAQELYGVHADLTMYGKALANGFPLAAIGGRRDLMELVRPGGVHHCGTYFGNLTCVAAACAVLDYLDEADYATLEHRTRKLADGICCLLAQEGIPAHVQVLGGMCGIIIGEAQPQDYASWWTGTDRKLWMAVAAELRNFGVLTDGFIGVSFTSFSHEDCHVDETLSACRGAIQRVKERAR